MSFATSSAVSCVPAVSSLEVDSEVAESDEEEDSEEELDDSDSELPIAMGLALRDPSLSGLFGPFLSGVDIGVIGSDSTEMSSSSESEPPIWIGSVPVSFRSSLSWLANSFLRWMAARRAWVSVNSSRCKEASS